MRLLFWIVIATTAGAWSGNCQILSSDAVVTILDPKAAPPTSDSQSLAVTAVNVAANSLTWVPAFQQIYLTLPSADGPIGNAVQVLDPKTGALGANIFVGSEPDLIAVSSSSKYLYIGLDGASTVQRVTLPDLIPDITIQLGSNSLDGPLYAADVQTSPLTDGTVAVVRNAKGVSPAEEGGVVIYDDGVARPNVLCGFIQIGCSSGGGLFDSIQWNSDGTYVFAANNEDTGFDFYRIPVTASGFGKVTDYGGLAGGFSNAIHFDRTTGLVYEDSGPIIDPFAGVRVGTFGASGLMVPDGALGKAFFLKANNGTYTVTSFDMHRLTPIATATISNVTGSATHLIRWGTNGLAFTTSVGSSNQSGPVYILSGPFVSDLPPPTITPGGIAPIGNTSSIVAPGEWITISGANLARDPIGWDGDFPTSLDGTSVTVHGKAAYLLYVSPREIVAQVPDDATTGQVPVQVHTASGTATSAVILFPYSPALPLLDSIHVFAIILRSDGSGAYGLGTYDIAGPTGNSLGFPTVAAKAGDSVELFALGLGPTNPAVPSGQAFSGTAPTANPVTVLLSGTIVIPTFAGLYSAGYYRVNFTVPPGLGSGDIPLQLIAGGLRTPAGEVISLQ